MSVQLKINQSGGLYDHGRDLPRYIRDRVLDLHHEGVSQRAIAQAVSTSRHFIQNVIRNYDAINSSLLQPKSHKGRTVLSPNVIDCLEIEKLSKPSTYCSELSVKLKASARRSYSSRRSPPCKYNFQVV